MIVRRINFLETFSKRPAQAIGFIVLLACNSCSTFSKPLPPVDLHEAGWQIQQGQAIWTLPKPGPDLAGDLVVATGPEGKSFVQFSKTPFQLVVGQTTSNHWQIQFPSQNIRYAGPGSPPKRLIWLYLPSVLSGAPPPRGWTWLNPDGNWRLENSATGEKVEGFLAPP
jgi:hypothetical protein